MTSSTWLFSISGDSPTKAAFAPTDIGVAEVTLGLGAVVSKLLNGCLKAQRRRFTQLFVVVHRWGGNPTIVAEWSLALIGNASGRGPRVRQKVDPRRFR